VTCYLDASFVVSLYHRREPLSSYDEKAIVDYMQTLKTLIQKVEE
jgi:hypothetical protein